MCELAERESVKPRMNAGDSRRLLRWPKMLACLNDAGLWFPCYQSWGFDTANEPNLGKPAFD